MEDYFAAYCQLVQWFTIIYFNAILPFIWFYKKGNLISTHEFLSTFYSK